MDANIITNNGVSSSGYGVYFSYSNWWKVGSGINAEGVFNEVNSNYYGIYLGTASTNNKIVNTTACDNSQKDLHCDSGNTGNSGTNNKFGGSSKIDPCGNWPKNSDYSNCVPD